MLIRRLTLAMLIVLVGAVALATFLNYAKFDSTLRSLVRSRFEVVGLDLRLNVEHGLDLGLTLAGLSNTQQIIEQAKQASSEISAIEVFDDHGVIRFSTTAGQIGARVPAAWRAQLSDSAEAAWTPRDDGDAGPYRIGLSLTNSLQKTVGAIVISYPRSYVTGKVGQTLRYLIVLAALLIVGGTVAAYAVITLMFGGMLRSINRLGAPAQGSGWNEPALVGGSGLESAFARFLHRAELARTAPLAPGNEPVLGQKG